MRRAQREPEGGGLAWTPGSGTSGRNGRAGTALCPPSEPFPAPERVSVQDDDQPSICYGTQGDLKIHSRLELGFERPLMRFLVYAKNHIRFSKCCMYMELFLGNRTTVKNKTFSDLSA